MPNTQNQHHACPFSQIILSGKCGCELSSKDCLAEKEFGTCLLQNASQQCQSLYQNLRSNSNFALGTHHQTNLTVSQQAKIKMGGLLALQEIINQTEGKIKEKNKGKVKGDISNIFHLVNLIKQTYQHFENLPFSQLMPTIVHFKFRRKP